MIWRTWPGHYQRRVDISLRLWIGPMKDSVCSIRDATEMLQRPSWMAATSFLLYLKTKI
jgi:hypothetical protein